MRFEYAFRSLRALDQPFLWRIQQQRRRNLILAELPFRSPGKTDKVVAVRPDHLVRNETVALDRADVNGSLHLEPLGRLVVCSRVGREVRIPLALAEKYAVRNSDKVGALDGVKASLGRVAQVD